MWQNNRKMNQDISLSDRVVKAATADSGLSWLIKRFDSEASILINSANLDRLIY